MYMEDSLMILNNEIPLNYLYYYHLKYYLDLFIFYLHY